MNMPRDKWKNFPCKTCLIHVMCNTQCFYPPPSEKILDQHIADYNKEGICLMCGGLRDGETYMWACKDCETHILFGMRRY